MPIEEEIEKPVFDQENFENNNPSSTITTKNPDDGTPAEKVVKDQNLLNSDEKLFENLINKSFCLKTIFENVMVSQSLAGKKLFKTFCKLCYNNNITLLEDSSESLDNTTSNSNKLLYKEMLKEINNSVGIDEEKETPTTLELVKLVVNNLVEDHKVTSYYSSYLDNLLLSTQD